MTRFVLVGESHAALTLAEMISASGGGQLVGVFTDPATNPKLVALAERGGIPVAPAEVLRAPDAAARVVALDAGWLVNVMSAIILPAAILELFPGRALNLHNGPLPQYAGRHVHQWAIRNGETEFGTTIHVMEPGIDTGPVVARNSFDIAATDTGLSLYQKTLRHGAQLFAQVLGEILAGRALPAEAQDLARRRLYRHRDALDGTIAWHDSAARVRDFIRAGNYHPLTSPSYTARLALPGGGEAVVLAAEAADGEAAPGRVLALTGRGPEIGCGTGSVVLTRTMVQGRPVAPESWAGLLSAGDQLPPCCGV